MNTILSGPAVRAFRTKAAELVCIDPENDFVGGLKLIGEGGVILEQAALGVPGAKEDLDNVTAIIDKYGDILDIHVTQDIHHETDLGDPRSWENRKGEHPPVNLANPVFPIFDGDIQSGEWRPVRGNVKPRALNGQTIEEYFKDYSAKLVAKGNTPIDIGGNTIIPISYPVMVYNTHCLLGKWGSEIYKPLREALGRWEINQHATVNYLTKGDSPWAECYGGLCAEIPLPGDQSTEVRWDFLKMLQTGNDILFTGEAFSHCLLATLLQVITYIGVQYLAKIVVLTDCTSCIPKVGDSPFTDFPALTAAKMDELKVLGVTAMTSKEYFALPVK